MIEQEILDKYQQMLNGSGDADAQETAEWLEALDEIVKYHGPERATYILSQLLSAGYNHGLKLPFLPNTPFINTIPADQHPPYPGNRQIERRIKSLIRWNAMAMVVNANQKFAGIGGHISTYASSATLYEVGFNHFFKGKGDHFDG